MAANRVLRDAARRRGRSALGIPLIVPRPGLCTDNGAMIGAAGARRFAAGERAGLDLDARPSLPLAAPMTAGRAGPSTPIDAAAGPRPRSAPRGLRASHALSQNFLADPDVLEAILAEAGAGARPTVLEIGPGLGS